VCAGSRFAPKPIKTPQTVLRVTKHREPGRPRRVWFRLVRTARMRRTTSLLMGIPNASVVWRAIRGHPQIGFRCSCRRPRQWPCWIPWGQASSVGWTKRAGDTSAVSALDGALNSVPGLRTIAERINRPGRMKRAHRPETTRSEARRFGDRFRERLRISSWCLTSPDSATTERAPPGPASRAGVASRCRRRMARSRTARSSHSTSQHQELLRNSAIHHAQGGSPKGKING
jgi:hypothetical protein